MRLSIWLNLAALALAASLAGTAAQAASTEVRCETMNASWRMPGDYLPPLNRGLGKFALRAYGQKIGSGECTDIGITYLKSASGRPFNVLGPTGLNADYVWGNLVATASPGRVNLSSVMPGDIIQMRNVVAKFKMGSTTWTKSAAHHTAIVFSISPDNTQVCTFEQNPGPVRYGMYDLRGLQSGTMWFYRPVY